MTQPVLQWNEGWRETIRCAHCRLNQFRTQSGLCRKCGQLFQPSNVKPAEKIPTTLAGRIALARRKANLSQNQLGTRLNAPRTYISKIENGRSAPGLPMIQRLAKALQCDIEVFFPPLIVLPHEREDLFEFLGNLAPYVKLLTNQQRVEIEEQAKSLFRMNQIHTSQADANHRKAAIN